MVEKRPIWQVTKEEGHSRESADTETRNADTKERIVLFKSRITEDLEVEELTKHARTATRRVMTKTHAGSCIQRRYHNGLRIR